MKFRRIVFQSLAMVTQFGINMLVPIFLCSFLGLFIDEKFGTDFWFILLFFLGAIVGFRNVYIFAKRIYSEKSERDNRKG